MSTRSTMTPLTLGVLSTYPPRADGIASYTRDILAAVTRADPAIIPRVAALAAPDARDRYAAPVVAVIAQGQPRTFAAAGRLLARQGARVVALQHEFGLYGALDDSRDPPADLTAALLDALRERALPLVTTLHTVLPRPRPDIRASVQRLCQASAAVVVMAQTGARLLSTDYGVDPARLVVLPHGVPTMPPGVQAQAQREEAKQALGLAGHTVLCTFGLLGRAKSLETAIRALPAIVARHPEVRYLIVGQTHPQVRRREGESYRTELAALAAACGVAAHVRFVDRYLSQTDVLRYLAATDVYLTPYRARDQITSGTLSYALGFGRAIVSTPYLYATEVLAEGRGLLAAFDNPASIARCVLRYLEQPALRRATEERAACYGRTMAWPHVGARYAGLLRAVAAGWDGALAYHAPWEWPTPAPRRLARSGP